MRNEPREPRERDGKKFSLDLPPGYTCEDCREFKSCVRLGLAIPADEQCEFIPNDFALPGEESMARRLNREDLAIMEANEPEI